MTSLQTIPLSRLVPCKKNVRHTGRDIGIEALMASLEAHGLRQNLNVVENSRGDYEVVAGGRRLEALRRLAKAGRIDDSYDIWCAVLAEGDDPVEISLAENSVREAMHPDDECTAFQTLIKKGQSVEDVAARFGVTPAVVRQRLKLATVSPVLRKLFRKGELDLSQMMGFALVDDHAAQEAVWNDLPEWARDGDDIRASLTDAGMAANHRMARFVGIEAYEAAGGVVLRDLFEEDRAPVLVDAGLVQQLATRKLEEEAAHVQEEGWKWVKPELSPDYTTHYARVFPQDSEEGQPEVFAPEDIARAGVRVFIGYQGELEIDRGLMERDAKSGVSLQAEKPADAKPALPASLVEDLTAHRTAALRLELAHNPAVALAATVHAMAIDLLYTGAYGEHSCLQLSLRSERLDGHLDDVFEGSAHPALAGEIEAWQSVLPANPAGLWDWCLSQDRDRLIELMALLAGLSVNAIRTKTDRPDAAHLRHADRLAETLNLDMRNHWQPAAEGFFTRLTKGMMKHLLTEAGEVQQAGVLAAVKKPEAAQRTAAALLAKGWLPGPLLVTPHDDDDHDDDGAAAGPDDHDGDDDQQTVDDGDDHEDHEEQQAA